MPDPKIAPLWMNLPRFRQLCQGNFLDIIFSCPYELHELTANRFLSKLFFTLSDEQKEVLYYLFVKQYSTTCLLYTSRLPQQPHPPRRAHDFRRKYHCPLGW